jgi:hypothetical protein
MPPGRRPAPSSGAIKHLLIGFLFGTQNAVSGRCDAIFGFGHSIVKRDVAFNALFDMGQ